MTSKELSDENSHCHGANASRVGQPYRKDEQLNWVSECGRSKVIRKTIWVPVFKNALSKICRRQPLKKFEVIQTF